MNNSKHIEQQKVEDEFEVEITDLNQTDDAGRTQSWLFAESFLNWHRSISRRRWRLVSSIGISLLLVVFLTLSGLSSLMANILHTGLFSNSNATGTHPFVPYSSKPRPSEQDGLSCLVDTVWSPGSKYIAVVGYRLNCPQSASVPGLMNLYNASTGKLLRQLQPDSAILHTLNVLYYSFSSTPGKPPTGWRAIDSSVQQFYYSHLLWSPDGKRLALTFSTATFAPPLNGVLLMDVDGKHPQVLLQPQKSSNSLYAEWDVKSGVSVNLAPLPPAVAYRWGTGGSLIPMIPLTHNGVPLPPRPGPVGNPAGSATFTVWQSGFANWMLLEHESSVYTWSTDFAAWSPDGRYLVDGIGLKGLLSRPGLALPSQQSLVTHHLNQQPLLPAHDAALLRVATLYSAVTWRPDGRVLAAYNSEDLVELYDCVTGRRIGALRPHSNGSFVDGSSVLLRWSPDGTQLLLSSVRWGLVTVWGPSHGLVDTPS
jgi:WD40 repeat protein